MDGIRSESRQGRTLVLLAGYATRAEYSLAARGLRTMTSPTDNQSQIIFAQAVLVSHKTFSFLFTTNCEYAPVLCSSDSLVKTPLSINILTDIGGRAV